MKGCSFLQTTRGVVTLFIGFWICFVFIQQRFSIPADGYSNEKVTVDIESLLGGEQPPEIRVKNIVPVDEVEMDEVKNCRPYIMRGRALDWPALKKWNFQWIQDINITADVLTSPNLIFKYYNEEKGKEVYKMKGASALPSMFTDMSTHEAIQRSLITRKNDFKPLFYHKDGNGWERYYIRFDMDNEEELENIDVTDGILRCCIDTPRLWVSVQGSVSPMHWDGSYSCLAQIQGTKRMLFYSPDDVHKLGTYPKSHMFWRRSIFDPTQPDYERFPHASIVEGYLTIIHAGDVVCFPPKWLHYTDCLTHSISLTMRFEVK